MATRRYATGTDVPVQQSRNEIENLLRKHGAHAFGFQCELATGGQSIVSFYLQQRLFKIPIRVRDESDKCITHTPGGARRNGADRERALAAEERRAWRVAVLWLKAVLEAVESGLMPLETALLPHMVLPNGQTFAQWAPPQVKMLSETGRMPALLPGVEEAAADKPQP